MRDPSETETAEDSRHTTDQPSVADAVRDSGRSLAQILEYAGYLLSAKIDQLKLTVRTLIVYALLGVMAVIAAATLMIVSVVLLFTGLAHGLSAAMGQRDWVGDLVVGLVMVMAIGLSLSMLLTKFKTASRRRTMGKYENRRKEQRERFGQDIAQHASQ